MGVYAFSLLEVLMFGFGHLRISYFLVRAFFLFQSSDMEISILVLLYLCYLCLILGLTMFFVGFFFFLLLKEWDFSFLIPSRCIWKT